MVVNLSATEVSALRRQSSNPEIALKQQEMIDAFYQLHMTRSRSR